MKRSMLVAAMAVCGFFACGGNADGIAPDADGGGAPGAAGDASKVEAKTYAETCAGYCERARDQLGVCEADSCVARCAKLEKSAAADGCNDLWSAFLHCAVAGGKFTDCQFSGRTTVARCDDELAALQDCSAPAGELTPHGIVVDSGTSFKDGGFSFPDAHVSFEGGFPSFDAGIVVGDSGVGNQCASNCISDIECQITCPAPPSNGMNCCDTSSGVCYASSIPSCGG